MLPEEVKKKIAALRQEIEQHNHNYYKLNQPTITDFEFDILIWLDQFQKVFLLIFE